MTTHTMQKLAAQWPELAYIPDEAQQYYAEALESLSPDCDARDLPAEYNIMGQPFPDHERPSIRALATQVISDTHGGNPHNVAARFSRLSQARVDEAEALIPVFDREVSQLAWNITIERARFDAAARHLTACQNAVGMRAAAEKAAQEERARAARTCPICGIDGEFDVKPRTLLPHELAASPTIRCCSACWTVASALYIEQLGQQQLGTSRRDRTTRRDRVAQHLNLVAG